MKEKLQKHKGFTLIEMLTAIGIMAAFAGFAVVTISVIAQANMRKTAQAVKDDFEYARSYARTHSNSASFNLKKTDVGIDVIIMSKDPITGDKKVESLNSIEDRNLAVFYKVTGDKKHYQLGDNNNEHADVTDATLVMEFSQTNGAVIGPHYLDYMVLSNGNKNFKLFIKQSTGMMFYDYEIEEEDYDENVVQNDSVLEVTRPYFITEISPKSATTDIEHAYDNSGNLKSVQPQLNYDARYIKIGGVYRAKEIGEYEIIFSLKDPYSTTWENGGGTDDIILTWRIY